MSGAILTRGSNSPHVVRIHFPTSSVTISLYPLKSETTSGIPQAMASSSVRPKVSWGLSLREMKKSAEKERDYYFYMLDGKASERFKDKIEELYDEEKA